MAPAVPLSVCWRDERFSSDPSKIHACTRIHMDGRVGCVWVHFEVAKLERSGCVAFNGTLNGGWAGLIDRIMAADSFS